MSRVAEHRTALAALPEDALVPYLTAHSGLPGPRGNLELIEAFADIAPAPLILRFANDEDEYLRCCGTVGVGRLVVENHDEALVDLLRTRATDAMWRVREAVAMAAQRLGDADPARLRALVADWVADPHPLVRRAAIAAVCEPRLLRDPATASAALDACATATSALAALPATTRRDPDVRTLRQALGYCWSVAVAGSPPDGLPRFAALAEHPDADVQWVVRENRTKARLRRLLD